MHAATWMDVEDLHNILKREVPTKKRDMCSSIVSQYQLLLAELTQPDRAELAFNSRN